MSDFNESHSVTDIPELIPKVPGIDIIFRNVLRRVPYLRTVTKLVFTAEKVMNGLGHVVGCCVLVPVYSNSSYTYCRCALLRLAKVVLPDLKFEFKESRIKMNIEKWQDGGSPVAYVNVPPCA